jgi:hypothetical protein
MMRCRFLWAAVMLAGEVLRAAVAPVRVAVMDFAAPELSHRSAQSAADFTAALQAVLGTTPGVEWVERERIALAARELDLAGLGVIEPSEAARAGRWAGADWALFGMFRTNSPGAGRVLSLELVDLARAVPLARTNLAVSAGKKAPLAWSTDDVAATSSLLGPWMTAVAASVAAETNRPVVALIAQAYEGVPDETESVEPVLASVCAAAGIRFHRLAPGPESLFESEAFLTGRTSDATNRPTLPADLLLFAQSSVVGTVRLTAWNRGGRASELHVMPRDHANAQATLTRWLPGVLKASTNSPNADERAALALDVVARASSAGLMRSDSMALDDAPARRRWIQGCAMVDVALQLAPESRGIREVWTRQRWAPQLAAHHARPFHFKRRALAAWLDLVTRHGPELSGDLDALIEDPKTANPSSVIARLMEDLDSDLWRVNDLGTAGMPEDMGGRVVREWHRRLMASFLAALPRLLDGAGWKGDAVPLAWILIGHLDDRPPSRAEALARVEALRRVWPESIRSGHFIANEVDRDLTDLHAAAGIKGREGELLAQLAKVPGPVPPPVVRSTNAALLLPPLALLDEGLLTRWFAAGPRPDRTVPPASPAWAVRFPARTRVKQVTSAVFHEGALWISGRADESVPEPAAGRQPDADLAGEGIQEVWRVWRIDGAGTEAVRVATPRSISQGEALVSRDGVLGLQADGRWWRRTGQDWTVAADLGRTDALVPGLRLWNGIVQGPTTNGLYTNLVPAALWPEVPVEMPFLSRPFTETAGAHFLTEKSLYRITRVLGSRPSAPAVPGPWSEGDVTAFLEDGPTLWIGTRDGVLAGYDLASRRYVWAARFGSEIRWLRRGGGVLWVAFEHVSHERPPGWAAFRVDPAALPPAPAEWGQALKQAKGLSPEESASRALFSGHPDDAARAMEAVPAALRTSMGWLLLVAALEDLGPARQPDFEAARRELRTRFPGSVAEKVLSLSRRGSPPPPNPPSARPSPEERADAAMAWMDRNRDGFIDMAEFGVDPQAQRALLPGVGLFRGMPAGGDTTDVTARLWQPVFENFGLLFAGKMTNRFSREDLVQGFSWTPRPPPPIRRPARPKSTNSTPAAGTAP